jgi:hypothetical protein
MGMWVVGACAGQWEAIVDRHDVCLGPANADDKVGERTCGVELRHGSVEGAESHDIEELEDLACALAGVAREVAEDETGGGRGQDCDSRRDVGKRVGARDIER